MKKLIFAALLFLIPLTGVLIGGEIILRAYNYLRLSSATIILSKNKNLIYEHKPLTTYKNKFGITVHFNSQGFIGNELGPKSADKVRVLGLGDSITEALYLAQNDRYLDLAASLLSRKLNREVEVINAAVGGYNTQQELELLKTKGINTRPDLVILGLCLNDFVNIKPDLRRSVFGRILEVRGDNSKARHFDFLYRHSQLYKFVYDFLANTKNMMLTSRDHQRFLYNYHLKLDENEWRIWQYTIDSIVGLCRQNNISLIILIFPLRSQLERGELVSYAPLVKFLQDKNVDFVDFSALLYASLEAGSEVFEERDMIHPNKLGHQIIAQGLVDYIVAKKIMH